MGQPDSKQALNLSESEVWVEIWVHICGMFERINLDEGESVIHSAQENKTLA